MEGREEESDLEIKAKLEDDTTVEEESPQLGEPVQSPQKVSSVAKSKSRSITPEGKSPTTSYKPSLTKSSIPEKKTSSYLGGVAGSTKTASRKITSEVMDETNKEQTSDALAKLSGGRISLRGTSLANTVSGGGAIMQSSALPNTGNAFPCAGGLLQKRSPFIHNPPQPEERRSRIQCPRTPREYLINLREDLADFQESHGLPRTRDYSFVSLGLALAQETGRAIYSVFLMLTELFPILAIVSLIMRFALDKLIEILETTDTVPKVKKSIIFALEMVAIMIPLWILVGTIIIPLLSLLFSIFKKMLRIKGGRKKTVVKSKQKVKTDTCSFL